MAKKILSKKEITNLVKKVAKKAQKDNINISKAFIFGSYAKNKMKSNSDLDLCFVSPNFKNTIEAEAYLRTKIYFLNLNYNIPIYLIAYKTNEFNKNIPFVKEIKQNGKEINLNTKKDS